MDKISKTFFLILKHYYDCLIMKLTMPLSHMVHSKHAHYTCIQFYPDFCKHIFQLKCQLVVLIRIWIVSSADPPPQKKKYIITILHYMPVLKHD